MKNKLLKAALFTDIHFGRKSNAEQHNQDCLNFITWFIEQIKEDPSIDHIVFMGDFFENRSAINIATLSKAYNAVKMLDALDIPVFFIIGNHDLYHRNNRTVYSTEIFDSLKNFTLIDKPIFIEHVGVKGSLFCPFLFPDEFIEYRDLINSSPVVFSHLEFKGFIITGDTVVMEHGPDPDNYDKPKKIFCGHFHKRQQKDNIYYIGNTFPMDFSDANDNERGFAIYDHKKNSVVFHEWPDAPSYVKTKLSELLSSHKTILKSQATVKCLADQDITLEESNKLKETFVKDYNLREFTFEEETNTDTLEDTDIDLSGMELESTNNIVINLLGRIEEKKIKTSTLIEIFKGL